MSNLITRGPLFVNWNYTYRCNFNCGHCYSRSIEDHGNELGTEKYLIIADKLKKSKVFQVNLGGGEPTLRTDFLQIISYMSEKGLMVNLSTNGWLIDENLCRDLKKYGINIVFLSLDHIKPEIHDTLRCMEGSHKKVLECIDIMLEMGIKVKLSTVITKLNFNVIENLVELAENKKLNGIDFKRFKPKGSGFLEAGKFELSREQENLLFPKIKRLKAEFKVPVNLVYNEKPIKGIDDGCPCGKVSIAIRPNGDISPCVYNSLVIGNILKDDLIELWLNSPFLHNLRKNYSCLGLQ